MLNRVVSAETTTDPGWKTLYKAGAVAALLAGVIFRRNLAVEISLLAAQKPPDNILDWFALLQNNRLLGLTYLHLFDIVNYALLGLVFLALYALLRRTRPGSMAVATVLGIVGAGVYFASNTAFGMLSLSRQFAAATAETQRSMLQAAGQALLAISRFTSPGASPGTGGYLSLLLIAVAGLIIAVVMIRSGHFSRATAYVGILASALDLAYCLAYPFVSAEVGELLAVIFIPFAGLLLMIWHILIGVRLYRLARS